jgi:acetyl-CoA acetyltransferase
MMREVFVAGVGMTKFGRYPHTRGSRLGAESLRLALNDADIPFQKVDLLIGAHLDSGLDATLEVLHEFPYTGIPAFTVQTASATGSMAVAQAYRAIATGQADVVAAVGFERMISGTFSSHLIEQTGANLSSVSGFTPLSTFGMMKNRRMEELGESDETFARVVVKNFGNAALNPLAQRQRVVTLQDVLDSPLYADPLHKLELCPVGDGAATVILASESVIASVKARSPRVLASVMGSDSYHPLGAFGVNVETAGRIARNAYEAASIKPSELDLVELHDAASVEEIIYVEQLGLCAEGEGGKFIESGAASIGGRVAVNSSGGLIARGHPGGATGTAQIYEIVQQLRGEAGERQHPGARTGMAHMLGGLGMWIAHILQL